MTKNQACWVLVLRKFQQHPFNVLCECDTTFWLPNIF